MLNSSLRLFYTSLMLKNVPNRSDVQIVFGTHGCTYVALVGHQKQGILCETKQQGKASSPTADDRGTHANVHEIRPFFILDSALHVLLPSFSSCIHARSILSSTAFRKIRFALHLISIIDMKIHLHVAFSPSFDSSWEPSMYSHGPWSSYQAEPCLKSTAIFDDFFSS
jgi:hypothetical protein